MILMRETEIESASHSRINHGRSLSVLGSTGTIGCNALEVAQCFDYEVTAITGGSNVELLAQQALKFRPKLTVIADDTKYSQLKERLSGHDLAVAAGAAAVLDAAGMDCGITINGIVGIAGLKPGLEVVRSGGRLATANKESLVAAGEIFQRESALSGSQIWPIDSEHNAIFQIVGDYRRKECFDKIESITLTASGGPFRTMDKASLANVTPDQAVKHPNWNMGTKISVDSATMMNKGLELIEAGYLFNLEPDRIKILVHPQSIIHAMVHYYGGSTIMQASLPDMRIPISYILDLHTNACDTRRWSTQPLNMAMVKNLTFEEPDIERFPAMELCRQALKAGSYACIATNAANEVAVDLFLKGGISFPRIYDTVKAVLDKTPPTAVNCLEDVMIQDTKARQMARRN